MNSEILLASCRIPPDEAKAAQFQCRRDPCAPVGNPQGRCPLLPLEPGHQHRAAVPLAGEAAGALGTRLVLSYLLPTHWSVLRLLLLPSDNPWRSQGHIRVMAPSGDAKPELLNLSVRLVPRVSRLASPAQA